MNRKVLRIGIMPYQDYQKRSLAIARGKYRPRPNEPKIWFESVQSMAQVLSNENQLLLKTILDRKPESLKELEAATGRSSSNLSRTLKTMARYGPLLQDPGRSERIVAAVDRLARSWWLHRYPWAGSLSTAHTLLWYDRYGADVFRRLARTRRKPAQPRSGQRSPCRD